MPTEQIKTLRPMSQESVQALQDTLIVTAPHFAHKHSFYVGLIIGYSNLSTYKHLNNYVTAIAFNECDVVVVDCGVVRPPTRAEFVAFSIFVNQD